MTTSSGVASNAEAMHGGVPTEIARRVREMMPGDLGLVVESFRVRWM